jgi:hypothetical protein
MMTENVGLTAIAPAENLGRADETCPGGARASVSYGVRLPAL